ncbi:TPA: hypothetical protein QFT03_000377 [Kluyvera ascorbata]|uniref:hypothetical protein n=1 Tax=Kluyvera TaxID=579 RepID=UPI00200FA17B|nr:hypothetical protein [Kluyvera ascorbata]HDT6543476.1 hypothetical protein [Kluyvera ascorbata]
MFVNKLLIVVSLLGTTVAYAADDMVAAQQQVAHAQRMLDAAQGDVDSVNANYGHGTVVGWAQAASEAGALRSQAQADLKAAQDNLANVSANTMNVAASSLNPATKVQTKNGVVAAGSLPPTTQVAIAYHSVFSKPAHGGNSHSSGFDHGEHGTGNGANNAANSHSAHGLGGGDHIGGGRTGGGFHY